MFESITAATEQYGVFSQFVTLKAYFMTSYPCSHTHCLPTRRSQPSAAECPASGSAGGAPAHAAARHRLASQQLPAQRSPGPRHSRPGRVVTPTLATAAATRAGAALRQSAAG